MSIDLMTLIRPTYFFAFDFKKLAPIAQLDRVSDYGSEG